MPQSDAPKGRQAGLSLVEAMMTAALAAVTLTMAVPSFDSMRQRRTLDGHAGQLLHDLQYARSEAVMRNRAVRFSLEQTSAGSCYVLHTGAPGDCECRADGMPAACIDGAEELKTVLIPSRDRVTLTSPNQTVLFHPLRGTTSPTATLTLSGADGNALRHVVNVMGRIRSCALGGTMPGYRPC